MLFKQLDEINARYAFLAKLNQIKNTTNSKVMELNPILTRLNHVYSKGVRKLFEIMSEPHMRALATWLKELPEQRKIAVQNMSDSGWFPNEYCMYHYPRQDQSIDEFMEALIDEKYNLIKSKILGCYVDRHLILDTAFKLYEDGNHIACIPLFLTQIDGICYDAGLNHYFTDKYTDYRHGKKKPEDKKFPLLVKAKMESLDVGEDIKEFCGAIVEKADKAFISLGTHENLVVDDLNILNRHGILHGLKEYSGYSKEPNAKKILSLLCYVDLMISILGDDMD